MQVKAVFFARLKREVGIEELPLTLEQGSTVRDAAAWLERERDVSLRGCMVAVNEVYAQPEQVLHEGDEVAFLPPVAGGQGDGVQGADGQGDEGTRCELTGERLDLEAAATFLVREGYGAQSYFVGTVRSPNGGEVVEYIDYEAFVPMAEKEMRRAADLARERWGDLRVLILHRLGRLRPAEASILIGVASPHRRAALESCDFLIEHLKLHLPVWKHEATAAGQRWVAGQTAHETL